MQLERRRVRCSLLVIGLAVGLAAACGGGGDDALRLNGEISSVRANVPLSGGAPTITAVLVVPGPSPDLWNGIDAGHGGFDTVSADIPPGAEKTVAQMFADGELSEGTHVTVRRTVVGDDDESLRDDVFVLVSVGSVTFEEGGVGG